ncbi:glycosyltransferase [Francisella sp. Scap27]|uniref:bifunctional glycosyltransferase family 2/GtrA family protein n=1 Tax=Francisella sp. Scap27 TaxID=2589986 RepID=UPI0015BE8235|nr:bifunctional glycosyltransferase family 2/GtrA family protein [Francisella sp. Scap27]QLE78718.1 glycosyltransferase [Francisella sp. Scap27]
MSQKCFIIPTKNPTSEFPKLISKLRKKSEFPIFVVDDGSDVGVEFFSEIEKASNIIVLRHAINLGKGAALKTAFNEILTKYPEIDGSVTLDSDGQHSIDDALRVLKCLSDGDDFVLGCRNFTKDIPLKSYVGNQISKKVYQFLLGRKIKDTQTGLRGLSKKFMLDCLSIKSNRFEFETEQFVVAIRNNINIHEIDIETIYIENNSGSNFNPLKDSLRIYFILLRYVSISIITFLIDITVFVFSFNLGANILLANFLARTASILFQYNASKKIVFKSSGNKYSFLLFVSYVYFSGAISVILQELLVKDLGANFLFSKIFVETILFFIGFSVVRLLFRRKGEY